MPVVGSEGSIRGRQAGQVHPEQKVARSGGRRREQAGRHGGVRGSLAPLKRWCALTARGREASGPGPGPAERFKAGRGPREELEERCRRLETEVAYLKKMVPWSGGTGSDQGEGRGREGPARRGARAGRLLEGRHGPVQLPLACRTRRPLPGPSSGRPPPRYFGTANGCGHRHRQCLRAERGARSLQDAEDDARDGHQLRDSPRDRLPQVQLVQGQGRKDLRERHRARLRRRRAWGSGHPSPSSSSPGARPTSRV